MNYSNQENGNYKKNYRNINAKISNIINDSRKKGIKRSNTSNNKKSF